MPLTRTNTNFFSSLAISIVVMTSGCNDAVVLEAVGQRESAVVNGTSDSGHPAVGALHSGNKAACTATLIGKHTVLTAAHCVIDSDTGMLMQPVNFYIGGFPGGSKYTAVAVVVHPTYAGGNQSDVAVVRLGQDVTQVQPMPIASSAPSQGESVLLVGYGLPAEETGEFGVKRKAPNTIGKMTPTVITFYGTGGTQGNVCNGDSGGPTFATRGGVETQIGVHSTKGGVCGQEGNDMRVDAFHAWISTQAQGDIYAPGPSDQVPPSVQILNPLVGAVLGPAFNVDVKASDDVGVTRVALFLNGNQISELTAAPFKFPVQNVPAGNNTFEAVAFDSAGRSGSAVASVTVQSKPPGGTPPTPQDPPAGDPPAAPTPGSYGATCTEHAQCSSGLCALDTVTNQRFCTALCDINLADSCPGGSVCQPTGDKAVCGALHDELDGSLSGGCSVAGRGGLASGVWLLLGLGLMLVLSRRPRG